MPEAIAVSWVTVFALETILYAVGTAFIVLLMAKDHHVDIYRHAALTDYLTGLLSENKESLAILRAVVGLGSSLNIVTTAECVETANQLEVLRTEGCTDVQGYFFSPPRPAAEMNELLTALHGKVSAIA